MQIFRLLDVPNPRDGKESPRLHHGYQLLFTGDPQLAIDGHVSVSLVSATEIEFEVPSTVAAFAVNYKAASKQLKRKKKLSKLAFKAHSTAADQYDEDPSLLKLKYRVDIGKMGETLTNGVFDASGKTYGVVRPQTAIVEDKFEFKGKEYPTMHLFAQFNIARVEATVRRGEVGKKKTGKSLIADDLDNDGEEEMSGTD